jgi:hypothetical protein
MSHIVNPPVPFIHQEPSLCGPACAQMILVALNKAQTGTTEQYRLWTEVQNATPGPSGSQAPFTACGHFPKQICERCSTDAFCWCSHPDALANAINDRLGQDLYKKWPHTSEFDTTECVLDNVDADIAAPVLVRGYAHWVVVHGYETGSSGIDFHGRSVTGLLVQNPEWDGPKQAIALGSWNADYLMKITCGSLSRHIVVLGKPARRPSVAQPKKGNGVRNLDVEAIRRIAVDERLRLATHPYWSPAFASADAGTPVYVSDLDHTGRDYFIVDFTVHGVSTGRLIVGAQEGEVRETTGIETTDHPLPLMLPREVIHGLDDRPLGWRFCDQSKTPFLPFYLVNENGATIYIRVDGRRFTELTNRGAG